MTALQERQSWQPSMPTEQRIGITGAPLAVDLIRRYRTLTRRPSALMFPTTVV